MTASRKIMIAIPMMLTVTALMLLSIVYCKARYATAETVLKADCLLTHTDEAAAITAKGGHVGITGGELQYDTFTGEHKKELHTWLMMVGRDDLVDRTAGGLNKKYQIYYWYGGKNLNEVLSHLTIYNWHASLIVSLPVNIITYLGALKRYENA